MAVTQRPGINALRYPLWLKLPLGNKKPAFVAGLLWVCKYWGYKVK